MNQSRIFRIEKESLRLGKFQLLEVAGFSLWLKPYELDSVAFFNSCSHKGGELSCRDQFVCKQHGWTYSLDGSNVVNGAPGLHRVPIHSETSEYIEFRLPYKSHNSTGIPPKNLVVRLLSHACLLLQYDNFKVLIDPWLFGNAYYGSWRLYPEVRLSALDTQVDAIIVTHPHPDHFHLDTLKRLSYEIPIFFPSFQSGIIERGLDEIKRANRFEIPWMDSYFLNDKISFQFLQPKSLWEDSALFVHIKDQQFSFNWLNLVDAGAALWENELPALDLLSSTFNQGASGYPLTWNHLNLKQKTKILKEQKKATLNLLPRRCQELNVKYFLPFAGHWRLALPEHQKYQNIIPQTTLDEVEQSFRTFHSSTKVLKILPGEEFNFKTDSLSRFALEKSNTESMLDARNLNRSASGIEFNKCIGKFESFMEGLVRESEYFGVEWVDFTVAVEGQSYEKCFSFKSRECSNDEAIKVGVKLPERIFCMLAEGNGNWDHVAIGYWGEWNRSPNKYPPNFMRLLQVGKSKFSLIDRSDYLIEKDDVLRKTIGELMEISPQRVSSILNRAGLPCGACLRTNTETLEDALALHGIDHSRATWILRELGSNVL